MSGRLIVLEDEWVLAENTRRMLRDAGYDVCAVLTSPAGFAEAVQLHKPELAVVDVRLMDGDGIEVVRSLRPDLAIPVLYVSAHTDKDTLARASVTLCRGFVAKPFTEAQLLASVQVALAAGRSANADATLSQIRQLLAAGPAAPGAGAATGAPPGVGAPEVEALGVLSRREREIVNALVEQRRVSRVATTLFISQHTVRNHLKAIFAKLGVHSQDELVDLALGRAPTRRESGP